METLPIEILHRIFNLLELPDLLNLRYSTVTNKGVVNDVILVKNIRIILRHRKLHQFANHLNEFQCIPKFLTQNVCLYITPSMVPVIRSILHYRYKRLIIVLDEYDFVIPKNGNLTLLSLVRIKAQEVKLMFKNFGKSSNRLINTEANTLDCGYNFKADLLKHLETDIYYGKIREIVCSSRLDTLVLTDDTGIQNTYSLMKVIDILEFSPYPISCVKIDIVISATNFCYLVPNLTPKVINYHNLVQIKLRLKENENAAPGILECPESIKKTNEVFEAFRHKLEVVAISIEKFNSNYHGDGIISLKPMIRLTDLTVCSQYAFNYTALSSDDFPCLQRIRLSRMHMNKTDFVFCGTFDNVILLSIEHDNPPHSYQPYPEFGKIFPNVKILAMDYLYSRTRRELVKSFQDIDTLICKEFPCIEWIEEVAGIPYDFIRDEWIDLESRQKREHWIRTQQHTNGISQLKKLKNLCLSRVSEIHADILCYQLPTLRFFLSLYTNEPLTYFLSSYLDDRGIKHDITDPNGKGEWNWLEDILERF